MIKETSNSDAGCLLLLILAAILFAGGFVAHEWKVSIAKENYNNGYFDGYFDALGEMGD